MSEAREGLHEGAAQYARVKITPRVANRSRFGVRACGWPPSAPIQSFKSSMAIKSTLGLAACSEADKNMVRAKRSMCFIFSWAYSVGLIYDNSLYFGTTARAARSPTSKYPKFLPALPSASTIIHTAPGRVCCEYCAPGAISA